MSFFNLLEKIRKQPRFIRVQVLWVCVLVCMVVIFSLWAFSLKRSFSSLDQKASISEELSKPLSGIKDELPSLRKAFKDSLGAFFEQDEIEEKQTEPKPDTEDSEVFEPEPEEEEETRPTKLPLSP